jgi:protein-disulfide isomerase
MKHLASLFVLAALLSATACAQPAAQNADPDRVERILTNLRYEFPQLQNVQLEMRSIEPSGIEGLDRGIFVINGQQEQAFLITRDDTQLYIVAAGPIDASRDAEGLAAAQREREAAAAGESQRRAAELNQTFAYLPVRGNPDAPVTIVEFSDFQCPFCARAHETVERVLANNSRDVRLIYVQYPLPNHQWARPASIAALCAAQQDGDAFWTLHDNYFENQRAMNAQNVLERSRQWIAGSGVNIDQWNTCVQDTSSPAHQEAVARLEEGMAVASELGVSGTPAFFVNGRFLGGAQPAEVFQALIDEARGDAN